MSSEAESAQIETLMRIITRNHVRLRRRVVEQFGRSRGPEFDVDDVLQQAYVRAVRSVSDPNLVSPRLESDESGASWLETVVRNTALDMLRQSQAAKRDRSMEAPRYIGTDSRSYAELVAQLSNTGTSPSEAVRREEEVGRIIAALATLTEEQRTVIRLRFLEGRSVPEVAAEIGKATAAVHMLCHRALSRLREILGQVD